LVIDWVPVFQFVLFTIINTPPNFLWQQFLEESFPAYHAAPTNEAIRSASAPDSDKKLDSAAASGKPLVEPKLNIRNTLIKTALDQTVGAAVNTALFLTFMHSIKMAMPSPQTATAPSSSLAGLGLLLTGKTTVDLTRIDPQLVVEKVKGDFWGLIRSGWTFWPFVSLINFAFVKSLMGRNLVGSLAGMAWTIYVSIFTAKH
jgi:hypothetical protein